MEEGDTSDPDEEDHEISEVSGVPMLPKMKPRKGGLIHSHHTTQQRKVTGKVTFVELEPRDTDFGLLSSQGNQTQHASPSFFLPATSDSESGG